VKRFHVVSANAGLLPFSPCRRVEFYRYQIVTAAKPLRSLRLAAVGRSDFYVAVRIRDTEIF
jgi:hypothetical protein